MKLPPKAPNNQERVQDYNKTQRNISQNFEINEIK